jgi:hypothetical protein
VLFACRAVAQLRRKAGLPFLLTLDEGATGGEHHESHPGGRGNQAMERNFELKNGIHGEHGGFD